MRALQSNEVDFVSGGAPGDVEIPTIHIPGTPHVDGGSGPGRYWWIGPLADAVTIWSFFFGPGPGDESDTAEEDAPAPPPPAPEPDCEVLYDPLAPGGGSSITVSPGCEDLDPSIVNRMVDGVTPP